MKTSEVTKGREFYCRGSARLNAILCVGALGLMIFAWAGVSLMPFPGWQTGGPNGTREFMRQLRADSRTFVAAVRFLVEFDRVLAPARAEDPASSPLDLAMPTNSAAGVPTA